MKIRKIRELKGYDQKYMAQVLGMNQSNYSRIESDTINVSNEQLIKLAKALDVTPEYINAFDEKLIFQNCSHGNFGTHNTYNEASENERLMFTQLLKVKDDMISMLQNRLKKYED